MANKTFDGVKMNVTLKPQNSHANLSSTSEDIAVQMGKIQEWYKHIPLIGTCTTPGSSTNKSVACPGFQLKTGARIIVFFTESWVAGDYLPTMDVENSGAIHVFDQYGRSDNYIRKDMPCEFMYDGTNWMLINDKIADFVVAQKTVSSTKKIIGGSLLCWNGTDYDSIVTYSGNDIVIDTSASFAYPAIILGYVGASDIEPSLGTATAKSDTYYAYPCIDYTKNGVTGSKYRGLVFLEVTFNSTFTRWSPSRIVYDNDNGAFVEGKGYIFLGYGDGLYRIVLVEFHPTYMYVNSTLSPADVYIAKTLSAGTQSYTTDTSKFHPVLFSPNSVTAGFTHDVADPTAAVYNTRSNEQVFFTNKFLVSDGGTLLVNGLAMASVYDTANMTGISMQGSRFIHTALTPNESTVNSALIRGYAGKIGNSGTGQLCQVGASGLTLIAGGDIGDTLAGEIADDQTSADAAKLTLYSDSSGDPITAVGSDITGRSNSLVLAANSAIFFVGPAGTVDDKPIRRGFYIHPGTSDYSSRPRLVPSENGTAILGTQSTRWRSAYINTVYGELNGTIASSTTATTQAVGDNSTKVATTAYVDNSISALDSRYGSFGQTTDYSSTPWAKLCYYTAGPVNGTSSIQRKAVLLVTQYLNETTKMTGILVISSCTKATAETSLKSIEWLVADPGINTDNFVLVETDSISEGSNTAVYELWVKVTANYQYIIIKPLIETTRNQPLQFLTFVPNATGASSYTAGTSALNSSLVTLKNNISGNADTATYATSAGSATSADSATNATYFTLTNINPSSQTNYYPVFKQTGTNKPAYYNAGYMFTQKAGTATVEGLARLTLGNSTAAGTSGNKTGELVLYSSSTGAATLKAAGTTSAVTLQLPAKSGTLSTEDQVFRGGSFLLSSNGGYWCRVASIVVVGNKTYGAEILVSQTRQGLARKAAGILQITCATTTGNVSSQSYSLANWMYAGGNIQKSRFKLLAYDNSKYDTDGSTIISETGTTVFELWVQGDGQTNLLWVFKPLCEEYFNTNNDSWIGHYFTFYKESTGQASLPTATRTIESEYFTQATT